MRVQALSRALREGSLKAETLTGECLGRIQRFDPLIGAMVEVWPERALRQARATDLARGVLSGMPIVIKDLGAVRGTRLGMGSRATRYFFSPFDDLVVGRLRRAGLVFLGKSATSEFGVLPVTEPVGREPTRNPFASEYSAGGSSGGSAAAVAAEFLPCAVGSDGGGSLRIPAAFCGLVGMKPSRGLVTNPFGLDAQDLIWTCGPLAHTVMDAALLLDAMVTPIGLSDRVLAARLRHLSGLRPDPTGPTSFAVVANTASPPLRVGWTTMTALGKANDEVCRSVQRVAEALTGRGHEVSEHAPLASTSPDEFLPIWQRNSAQLPFVNWQKTEPLTAWLGRPGQKVSQEQHRALVASITERTDAWFGDSDVLLTPTVGVAAPRVGAFSGLPPREAYEAAAQIAAFTAVFNVTGQPAINLPAGFSSSGVPFGVQLVGRRGHDVTLWKLAAEVEAELGFEAERSPRAQRAPWDVGGP